jgi:hypothetical protein
VQVLCPKCTSALPYWMMRTPRVDGACPACSSNVTVELFPAAIREETASAQPVESLTDQASCYEHPAKLAKGVCHSCGRFLCALCEVEMDGKTWCPSCLQLDSPRARPQTLERSRTLYDSIALFFSTWSSLFFYPIFVAPPIVFYLAIRYWKAPSSIIPRSKSRFWLALCLASIELCLAGFLVFGIYMAIRMKRTAVTGK